MQIKDCKTGTEVVLRGKIAGISADESSVRIETKEGSAMYYRPELLELVKPAEQAPVTVEMIQEAYDRLEELVSQCNTPVLLCMLAQNDLGVRQRTSTNDSVIKAPGNKGIKWNAARGFLFASENCLVGNPEAIFQGIKYSFEFLQREERKAALDENLDTPFEN